MDERKIMELSTKSELSPTDLVVVEDEDGTKTVPAIGFKKYMINNLIFDTLEDLKSASLKEGEVCMTLGYHSINDGGAARYKIEYDPAAVEDKGKVQYLHTSDTLRAKLTVEDYVTPEQFGAYGDGSTDDSDAIQRCLESGYHVKIVGSNKYKLSSAITLKSGMNVDFNNATLIPVNCNLFVKNKVVGEEELKFVTLRNFIANMSRGLNCISISHPSSNIIIDGFDIRDSKRSAIDLNNLTNGFTLSNGSINGKEASTTQNGISIRNTTIDGSGNIFNVDNVRFNNQYPAISIQNTGDTLTMNIKNCSYHNTSDSAMNFASFLECYGSGSNISLSDIYISKAKIFAKLNSNSGTFNIKNITCINCTNFVDILSESSTVFIDGTITMNGDTVASPTPVVGRLYGILHMNCLWNINNSRHILRDPSATSRYTGSIVDHLDPKNTSIIVVSSGDDILNIESLGNCFIDIKTASDIADIENGIEGQRIYLISSIGRSVLRSTDILISDDEVQLSQYKGIELKRINNRWVQI